MNNATPTTFNELMKLVLSIFPDAHVEMELDGEIAIYTRLTLNNFYDEEERLIPLGLAEQN